MATVEVVIRLTDRCPDEDIEDIQADVMDRLYGSGYANIEPIRVRFVDDTDNSCGCSG
jgi:hypothetical protein